MTLIPQALEEIVELQDALSELDDTKVDNFIENVAPKWLSKEYKVKELITELLYKVNHRPKCIKAFAKVFNILNKDLFQKKFSKRIPNS